jgi:diguanylate cyclase (GGDEF)-like protein/PAS domain S-box-containing protein
VGFEGTARDISERKKAEEALRKVSDRLSLATRAGGVGIWDFDTVNNVLVWDDVMLRLYGVTADNFGGAYEAWRKGLHPEDLQRGDAEIQMALRGEKEFDTEFRVIWPDGTIRNIRALAIVQRDASGKPTHMIGTNWDITELKQAEEALRESEERYRIILEQMHEGYYEVDLSGNYTFVNDASCRNLGYSREELIGNSFQIALSENEAKAVFQAYHEVYLSGEPNKGFIFEVLRKDGTVGFAESSITLLKNNRGEPVGFRSVGRDITERKQMQQKLEEIATHDFLTGLPNRVLLLDRFTIAAAMAHRNKVRLAVMSLDLDKFKSINDTLGHAAGDEVLKTVSTRLTGIIRASDTLARIGGDEFILVMMESNHINDASAIAQKILDAFVEPMLIDGRPVHLSTSIGIAIYPEDAEDMETLIKESDAAMYYSKGHGRNQFKFFGDGDVRISGDHKSAPN